MLYLTLALMSFAQINSENTQWKESRRIPGATVYLEQNKTWTSPDIVHVLSLIDYIEPQILPGQVTYSSRISLHELDCKYKKYRILESPGYHGNMGGGEEVLLTKATPWKRWYIGTYAASRGNAICTR